MKSNKKHNELKQKNASNAEKGVCYLPRVPPFMNPSNLRKLLSKRFEIERIYLEAEGMLHSLFQIKIIHQHHLLNLIFYQWNWLNTFIADHVTRQRRKTGGNHKTKYLEGWVEFAKKQEAKLAAMALNGTQIGGKKRRNLFYDDIWTIKYLPKFKWQNLTEKLAYDQKVREQRLKAQSNQAKKEINFYMEKVDLKKRLDKMEQKKAKKFDKQ